MSKKKKKAPTPTNWDLDYDYITKTVPTLVSEYVESHIALSDSFQRVECWSLDDKQNYIVSILKKRPVGTIIFADVESGSGKFFKELRELGKFKLLSMDGNNRTICVSEFKAGKFEVDVSEIEGSGPTELSKYDDLDNKYKEIFDNAKVNFNIVLNATQQDCSDIFLDHNEGKPPSAQEKRNAVLGDMSAWMREHSINLMSNHDLPYIRENNAKRLNDKDQLALLCVWDDYNIAPNEPRLEDYWTKHTYDIAQAKEFEKLTEKYVQKYLNHFDFATKAATNWFQATLDFFIMQGIMHKYETYSVSVLNKAIDLLAEEWERLFSSTKEIPFANGKLKYCSLMDSQKYGNEYWIYRIDVLKELVQTVLSHSDINAYTPINNNYNKMAVKIELAERQGFECPLTGDSIKNSWMNGEKCEVDHQDERQNGGHGGGIIDTSNLWLLTKKGHINKDKLIRKNFSKLVLKYPQLAEIEQYKDLIPNEEYELELV